MANRSEISQALERDAVVPMECTIPADMTIEQWRKLRSTRPRRARRRTSGLFPGARKVVPLRPEPCNHLHDSTTRYDHDKKLLTFLLVCPVCKTEKVIETQQYEPRFEPHPAPQVAEEPAGATVYELPVRGRRAQLRRAA